MSDDEDNTNRGTARKKSGFQFDVNIDQITQKINLGIEKLSKNIKTGFERASVKFQNLGQNTSSNNTTPIVGDDSNQQLVSSSNNSELSCGCCGTIISDELLSMLKSGREVVCENCGLVIKLEK